MIRPAVAALLLMTLTVGCGTPSFLVTPVQNVYSLEEQTVTEGHGFGSGKVALIPIEGMIVNMKTGGLLQPTENDLSRFVQELDLAARDDAVKAVVLRVNSPGGTVTASDVMYQTIKRFKAQTHKPVVASLQDVAASGAYYASCASDKIIAHPTSVVGSIGVIFNTFTISGTLEKIGAKSEAIKSGPLKDMGSPFKDLDPQAREIMQAMVDEYYKRFVDIVTSNRPLQNNETVKMVTDGRVFSGTRAAELGLVDRTGLLDDAIDEARKMAKAPGAKVVTYRRPFAYNGSIYAEGSIPQPQANVMQLKIPGINDRLPSGFYYVWEPGL